jgi:hypothetical protein
MNNQNESDTPEKAVASDALFCDSPIAPESVTLFAESLLSKWGFHDGDQLDWLYDFGFTDDHPVLIEVVKTKLLPALPHHIEVREISCIHNPIRASKIDGNSVEDAWFDPYYKFEFGKPDCVEVSGDEVVEIARRISSQNTEHTDTSR